MNVKKTCLGYVDMSHVLVVSELIKEPNTHGDGHFYVFYVTMAFLEDNLKFSSAWCNGGVEEEIIRTDTAKKHQNFLTKWKGVTS